MMLLSFQPIGSQFQPVREDALLRHGAEDPDERKTQHVPLALAPHVLLLPVYRLFDDGQQFVSHVSVTTKKVVL